MARSFDGSTDRIDWSNIWDPSGQDVTISFWAKWDGDDTYYAYLFNINDSGGNYGFLIGNPNSHSGDVRLFRKDTGNGYYNDSVGGALVSGTWVHLVFTSIGSSTDKNDIDIFKNGSEVSYSGYSDGGTEVSYPGTWSLGGRTSDDARNFGGDIAEFAVWESILSTGQITALAAGYSPLFFLSGIKAYMPLVRTYSDRISGAGGSLDGTTIVSHIPIIYPSHNSVIPFVPTAATEQSWIEYVSRHPRFSSIRR